MKISRLLSLLAVLAFSVSSARADYIATLLQVGPNVVMTGTGAINLTGLTFDPNASFQTSGFLNPFSGVVVMGPAAFIDLYAGLHWACEFRERGPIGGGQQFQRRPCFPRRN